MDCYELPAIVLDCTQGMLDLDMIANQDLDQKVLVLYTDNANSNGYGREAYRFLLKAQASTGTKLFSVGDKEQHEETR